MNIYNLLRFLVAFANLTVETPKDRRLLAEAKVAAFDLISKLEEANAFGSMAAISIGDPFHE